WMPFSDAGAWAEAPGPYEARSPARRRRARSTDTSFIRCRIESMASARRGRAPALQLPAPRPCDLVDPLRLGEADEPQPGNSRLEDERRGFRPHLRAEEALLRAATEQTGQVGIPAPVQPSENRRHGPVSRSPHAQVEHDADLIRRLPHAKRG